MLKAYIEEVRIAGTALPHPRSADDGIESLRVGVDEHLAAALLPGAPGPRGPSSR